MDAFFFWLFSAGMIGFSLAVVVGRNPVGSALCFATSMVFMAALFVMLNAFLFIIMLLDVGEASHVPRQKIWMGATLLLALGFVYLLARTLDASPRGTMTADHLPNAPAQRVVSSKDGTYRIVSNDDTHQIGLLLFTKYVAPFEVTSLLILVATIGVVVLCKEEAPVRRKTAGEVDATPRPETGPALTRTP
jgi:NADH-quinone oxidoreductase subunit J